MTATFDEPSYATGEEMTISVTVRNTGDERIGVTTAIREKPDAITVTSENTLEKLRLLPGNSVTRELTGAVGNANISTARLYLEFFNGNEQRAESFAVAVTPRYGRASGSVYDDANGNGKFDGGEGLGGATLTWTNKLNHGTELSVTTNSAGAFAIDVPTGPYRVSGKAAGLQIGSRDVTVPESGVDGLLFRAAARPAGLAVNMEFLKDSYKPDEAPAVRVTMTNNGDVTLTGIVATCRHNDSLPQLTGTGSGWSDLAVGGVTISPHRSRVLEVTEPMPANAANFGFVVVDCAFSYAGVGDDSIRDSDEASVPGQSAEVFGHINTVGYHGSLAGFRFVLTAADGSCPIVAQGTTNAEGDVDLGRVPVGRYQAVAVPPSARWWFKAGNSAPITVVTTEPNEVRFLAIPTADDQALTQAPDCPGSGGNPPAPQGSAGSGLAYTGASMIMPGIAGLVTLLAGLGAVLLSRRRRPSEEDSSQQG